MAYSTYITDALVCGSRNNNTSDRSYLLFTREAGMVWASAKSAREERSKHRYALQEFSVVRVSLVRGKSGWRITGAEPVDNTYFKATTREGRGFVRNIVKLLRRFVHGESAHTRLYDEVVAALGTYEGADIATLELAVTLRALHELGYVAPDARYRHILEAKTPEEAGGALTREDVAPCEAAIREALALSHL